MDRNKKRKRQLTSGPLQRSVSGSAFAACPVCLKQAELQVPLATIDIHLGGVGCSPSVTHDKSPELAIKSLTHSLDQQDNMQAGSCTASAAVPPSQEKAPPHTDHQQDTGPNSSTDHSDQQSPCSNSPSAAELSVVDPTCLVQPQQSVTGTESATTKAELGSCAAVCLTEPKPGAFPDHRASARHTLVPHTALPGEYVICNFVTAAEEHALINFVDAAQPEWRDSTFNGRHRGKRWGAEMDLGKRTVQEGSLPMPEELVSLIQRMQSTALLKDFEPNEANAIDYCKRKGHWLKAHVDDRQLSTNQIVTLSLGCAATMMFSNSRKNHHVAVKLPACALQIITKDARYMYSHGINNAHLEGPRRVSITFRQSPMKS